MRTSEKGVEFIVKSEGIKLKAYKAHPREKYLTIGVGHYGADVKPGMVITKEQAKALLHEDLREAEDAINENLNRKISQNQFDALVSFAFNVGTRALLRSTLWRYLQEGRIKDAANEFLKWNKHKDRILEGLSVRRTAERQMFLDDGEE